MTQPMSYVSTQGNTKPVSFSETLLGGRAPDGGLWYPKFYPKVTDQTLEDWRNLSFANLAFAVINLFTGKDIPAYDLELICKRSCSLEIFTNQRKPETFADVFPLMFLKESKQEDGEFSSSLKILELSTGPTLTSYDFEMQLLANLLEYFLEKEQKQINIFSATNVNNLSAVEYAFRGKKNIRIFGFATLPRLSLTEKALLYSIKDENIFNLAFNGGEISELQDMAKEAELYSELKSKYTFGYTDSTNWTRIMAQIVYFFWGYLRATKDNKEKVKFVIPEGKLNMLLAGIIAKEMGLPIAKLINVTKHETNVFNITNFERILFNLVSRDSNLLHNLFPKNVFTLDQEKLDKVMVAFGVVNQQVSRDDERSMICTFKKHWGGIILSPKTAGALILAFKEFNLNNKEQTTTLVMETEQAVTISIVDLKGMIESSTGNLPLIPASWEAIKKLDQTYTPMSHNPIELKNFLMKNCV